MNKLLTITIVLMLSYGQFGCVSIRELQEMKSEKATLSSTVSRLKKQNEELTNDKFELSSSVQSKVFLVQSSEQKSKDILIETDQKVQSFQSENEKLKEELKISNADRARLQQELTQKEKESTLEIERLKEKLMWVYRNYNIQKKK